MPIREVDWDIFEFRCHYLGELCTGAKGKSNLEKYNEAAEGFDREYQRAATGDQRAIKKAMEYDVKKKALFPIKDVPNLSSTCKRRLAQIYTEETTGRIKDIESIYIEKGLATEQDSITLYSLLTGKPYFKNSIRVNNGFLNGEIDFDDEEADLVIDTKSSFDIFTFDETFAKGLNSNYYWQGQGYMWLHNRSHFRLAYCLNDTPEELIQRMLKRARYNFIGTQDDWEEYEKEFRSKHTYKDLPVERKVRIYDFDRNQENIDYLIKSVPLWRQYLKDFKTTNAKDYELFSEETK